MGVIIFWALSAQSRRSSIADGLTDLRAARFTDFDRALQLGRAVEVAGLTGLFIPWSAAGDEPWIVAASLARHTRRVLLLPEVEIPFATPVYLAKMSVSFQRLGQRRLALGFNLERSAAVRQGHGDWLGGDEWYARAEEYLEVLKGVWRGKPYDFRGRFYDVEAGGFDAPLSGLPLPEIYTSGESQPALELAAQYADVHVLGAGVGLAARVQRLRDAAREQGRKLRVALRLSVLARHTDGEARRDAGRAEIDLLGSHEHVARRLLELTASGVDQFIVDGRSEIDEAYRFGEHILPLLRAAVSVTPSPAVAAASAP